MRLSLFVCFAGAYLASPTYGHDNGHNIDKTSDSHSALVKVKTVDPPQTESFFDAFKYLMSSTKSVISPAIGKGVTAMGEFGKDIAIPAVEWTSTQVVELGKIAINQIPPTIQRINQAVIGVKKFGEGKMPVLKQVAMDFKTFSDEKLFSAFESAGATFDEVSKKDILGTLKSLGRDKIGPAFVITGAVLEEFKRTKIPPMLEGSETWIRENPKFTAVILASGVVVLCPISGPALWVAGFSSQGPVAGSLAALVQSSLGHVSSGSTFAILQSAGMDGYGAAVLHSVTSVGGAVVGLGTGAYAFIKDHTFISTWGKHTEEDEKGFKVKSKL